MKKIFLKKYWLAFVSVLLVAGGIAWACAGGDDEEYRTSNFAAEGFVDSAYTPFYYSMYYYYGIRNDWTHNTRFNEANVKDWSAYLDNKVPTTEIDFLLNQASAGIADSAASFAAGKMKILPLAISKFKIVSTKNAKTTEFLNYLAIAKKCEEFAVVEYEPWDEVPKREPLPGAAKLNSELLSRFNKIKDQFLKQRYWFQLVRSYFFNGPATQAIDVFEKNQNAFSKNVLYYRTQAYAAGAYYNQKDYSKANYYYSKVYDGCNELKTVAHYSFHPQEESDWRQTLALCKDKNEQITLWQMLGVFYNDEKRSIEEIYKLDPSSEKLELLLVRAVNKEETKLIDWRERTGSGTPQLLNKQVSPELSALVNRIATAGNTSKPYLWHISAGYLKTLNGDYSKAQADYAAAEKTLPKQDLPQSQLRLFRLMNKVASASRIDAKLENEIMKDIEWLQPLEQWRNPLRFSDAYDWVRHTVAYKYNQQKEWVKAECYKSRSAFYMDHNKVEAMKAFLDKQHKTPYEKVCASLYDKTKHDLFEYQGVKSAFEDKLSDAIAYSEKSDSLQRRSIWGNPFNGRIGDCHDCDHKAGGGYNRITLLKKMKEMQDKVRTGDDIYNNALLLGNAFYNLSHYGNARRFSEGKVLGWSSYSAYYIDSVFRKMLISMDQATKYYSIALQSATTSEQKAKCHYMLAKCERNQWYNTELFSGQEYGTEPSVDFKAWEGFKALKEYSNTKYYQEVLKECGYFQTYISKQQ